MPNNKQNYLNQIDDKLIAEKGAIRLPDIFQEGKYNLALPCKVISYIPSYYKLILRTVKLDIFDYDNKLLEYSEDFYPTPNKSGFISPSAKARVKIGSAAGINWFRTVLNRERHPKSYELLSVTATVWGEYIDITGERKTITDRKTIDIKAMEASGRKRGDINKRREFAVERCVTGAKGRAVAGELGLNNAYFPEQLAKPFIAGSMVLNLDPDNPTHLKLLIERGQRASELLYGERGEEVVETTSFSEEASKPDSKEQPAESKPAPETSQPPRDDELEITAEINALLKKLDIKPPVPLNEMPLNQKKGFLANLRNKEATRAK